MHRYSHGVAMVVVRLAMDLPIILMLLTMLLLVNL